MIFYSFLNLERSLKETFKLKLHHHKFLDQIYEKEMEKKRQLNTDQKRRFARAGREALMFGILNNDSGLNVGQFIDAVRVHMQKSKEISEFIQTKGIDQKSNLGLPASQNFLKFGIDFDKKYGNIQNALHTRKAKVLDALLRGNKAVYKKKKKKRKAEKAFKTEVSEPSEDENKEWSDPSSRPHTENQKSDYEYQSSEDSMMGVVDNHASDEESSGLDDTISEDDNLSNVDAKQRKAKKLRGMNDIQKQILHLKKLKKQQKKNQFKNQKTIDEKSKDKTKHGDKSDITKPYVTKEPKSKKSGLDLDIGLGYDPSKAKSSIGEEIRLMKEKMKNMMGTDKKDKIQLQYLQPEGSKHSERSYQSIADRLKSMQNNKRSNKMLPDKSKDLDSLKTDYLDRAAVANAQVLQTLKLKKGVDDPSQKKSTNLDPSSDKLGSDQSDPHSKNISKGHSRHPSDLAGHQLYMPKGLMDDIHSKKEILSKQTSIKPTLAETLREHMLARERQKQEWDELANREAKMAPPTLKDIKPVKPIPAYEEINQYINTAAKVDSWNRGNLIDFITLKQKKEEGHHKEETTEITEYERELFDPSKNFMDILDLMLNPQSDSALAHKIEQVTTRPDIKTIKELLMDRKRKQVQLGKR